MPQKTKPTAAKPTPRPVSKPTPRPRLIAEQVLDGFIKNTGGAAYEKLTSFVALGSVQLTGQPQPGTVELKSKAPDRFLLRMLFPGQGEVATGYNGKEGWARDPNQGLRLLRGEELAQLRLQALQSIAAHRWRSYFKRVESLGVVQAGTLRLYRLRLFPKDGSAPVIQYHDTTTLLLVRTDQTQATPQGKLSTITYFNDWRTVQGITSAFLMRQKTKDLELTLTLTSIQNNLPLPETDFARPAEVPNKPAKVK
jgi:hypothetical protein